MTEVKLPAIEGKVTTGMYLRQDSGEGTLGDAKINLSTTAGLGGFSLMIAVTPKKGDTVYVIYDGQPVVEAVARAVIDGTIKPERPKVTA